VNVTSTAGAVRLANSTMPALASPTAIGSLLTPAHQLTGPTSIVTATVHATAPNGSAVAVFVRGRRPNGTWDEWIPAGRQFAEPVTVIQARIALTAGTTGQGPTVRTVTLTAGPALAAQHAAQGGGTYRVFATREGLIGGTTANGHVIVAHDHFVALPSERALSPGGNGNYTVRVCADSNRCEWAPVWDEGPWNIHDDYWNPASVRETWSDVGQGEPEAQAAYSDGYNGGKDGFGRKVLNPAGIDLADGTFWDGLALTDNAWVNVTYLWTIPAAVTGTIATELNVRTGPHSSSPAVGLADTHAVVPIVCQTHGDMASGGLKKTDLWDELATGYYVSDSYVDTGSTGQVAPNC
jgi:hypothetical protein